MLENSKAINENDLDRVNGGRILNATGMASCDINNPWEIVDNTTGQTLYRYNCNEAAIVDAVKKWGGSNYDDIRDITQDEVIAMRKASGIMN